MADEIQKITEYDEVPDTGTSASSSIVTPKTEVVSEKDIFKLAVWVLLAAGVIFLGAAAARIFVPGDGVKDVWDYTKSFITPIVTLVLGLYFGNKNNR